MIGSATTPYQVIADAIWAAAPQTWQKLIITSKVEDDGSESLFDYVNSEGDQTWFDPDSAAVAKIGRALRDLRADMTMPGEAPWSRCTFTLFADGKFKFDVEYDD